MRKSLLFILIRIHTVSNLSYLYTQRFHKSESQIMIHGCFLKTPFTQEKNYLQHVHLLTYVFVIGFYFFLCSFGIPWANIIIVRHFPKKYSNGKISVSVMKCLRSLLGRTIFESLLWCRYTYTCIMLCTVTLYNKLVKLMIGSDNKTI